MHNTTSNPLNSHINLLTCSPVNQPAITMAFNMRLNKENAAGTIYIGAIVNYL